MRRHLPGRRAASWFAALAATGVAVGAARGELAASASPGPTSTAPIERRSAPLDRPYPGEIGLSVDATDVRRRIVRVHETLSGIRPDTVLLYPKWLPGTHAPEGPIDKLAGLRISAAGVPILWSRDPLDVYAFRVHAGAAVQSIEIDFDYLSPTSGKVGPQELSPDLGAFEWNELVLYPSGYYARQIPVSASLTLPPGWQAATALETVGTHANTTSFARQSLETLIDSPVYAGRYLQRFDLDPGAAVPVHLDLFADRPELLAVTPEQLAAHRALVQQAYKLFASHHYAHYDFLYSLSDQIVQNGLEHHQSSEDGTDPESFTKWDKTAFVRDLLPHEYTHSWNGKFRRPADLWTPNYNVPMQDSLLWVYEGQTQYWGGVLAARSGLRTRAQALDQLALIAAYADNEAGRRWRSLADTTNDEIMNPRRPLSWPDFQRFEDYYDEGALIWLDADTLIRERSAGKRSLDDFARAFFGVHDGSFVTDTYTFGDVVKALNAVEPYDWAAFLAVRVDGVGRPAPLGGVSRGGYELRFTEAPGDYQAESDDQRKRTSLWFSIGVDIDEKEKPGEIATVRWDGAAFMAGLTEGTEILAVNGTAYAADVLKGAIRAAKGPNGPPIELIVKTGERFHVVQLDYHDGLRYPHLERNAALPARLDDILAPR
jgi:predicted metalloprotease with PDZ domain